MRQTVLAVALMLLVARSVSASPITYDFTGQLANAPSNLSQVTGWFTYDATAGIVTDFLLQTPLAVSASTSTNWQVGVIESFSSVSNLSYLSFYFVNWDYFWRSGGEAIVHLTFQGTKSTFNGGNLALGPVMLDSSGYQILPSRFECWGCRASDFDGVNQVPYNLFSSGRATVSVPEMSSLVAVFAGVLALGACRRSAT